MFAAALLPERDTVSPAVLEMERKIIESEGPYHVAGNYYRSEKDAATQRRWLAERRVREALRQVARLAECSYCFHPLLPSDETTVFAGKEIHLSCAHEFDSFVNAPTQRELDYGRFRAASDVEAA